MSKEIEISTVKNNPDLMDYMVELGTFAQVPARSSYTTTVEVGDSKYSATKGSMGESVEAAKAKAHIR